MEQVLIKERKYEGKYVALKDINHPNPIADGKNPDDVYKSAIEKGFKNPLILYVPIHGMVQIY